MKPRKQEVLNLSCAICHSCSLVRVGQMTINMLPDDALLEIFDFYEECSDSYGMCCFKATLHHEDMETAAGCMPKMEIHHL
jgi:hypothetical protein